MMKSIISVFLVTFCLNLYAQEDWSKHLERANNETEYCEAFFQLMSKHKDESSTAAGYFALSKMMLAKIHSNPFTKLGYFNKGKNLLEKTIDNNKQNVELRFLRFAVQNEIPAILLYFHDIDEDLEILNNYIARNDSPLANRIIVYYQRKGIEYLKPTWIAQ